MKKIFNRAFAVATLRRVLFGMMLAVLYQGVFAQHGHPLVGTWSGDWKAADGKTTGRVLVVIKFDADQVISGNIIENSIRAPITEATLDPATWTVMLKAEQTEAGGAVTPIEIRGVIENLGSATERAIVGTWEKGHARSELRLVIN